MGKRAVGDRGSGGYTASGEWQAGPLSRPLVAPLWCLQYACGYLAVAPLLRKKLAEQEAIAAVPGAPLVLSGITAGLLATVATQPADTIKTRMQVGAGGWMLVRGVGWAGMRREGVHWVSGERRLQQRAPRRPGEADLERRYIIAGALWLPTPALPFPVPPVPRTLVCGLQPRLPVCSLPTLAPPPPPPRPLPWLLCRPFPTAPRTHSTARSCPPSATSSRPRGQGPSSLGCGPAPSASSARVGGVRWGQGGAAAAAVSLHTSAASPATLLRLLLLLYPPAVCPTALPPLPPLPSLPPAPPPVFILNGFRSTVVDAVDNHRQ